MAHFGIAAPRVGLLDRPGLTVRTLDLHVGGQPIRLIQMSSAADVDAGLPDGCLDRLCAPPRGRPSDVIALYVPVPNGFYVRFHDVVGPIDMCGEGLIALATLAWLGDLVDGRPFLIDTARGPVGVRVNQSEGTATVRLPPARIASKVHVVGPNDARLDVAIVDGAGNVFAVCDAARSGLDLATATTEAVRDAGLLVREQLRRELGPDAPTMVQFADFDALPISRNVVVWGPGPNLDFGPCGTGSAARAAVLHSTGVLPVGSGFSSAGLSGQSMDVQLVECCNDPECTEVIVELTATAHLTGQVDHHLAAGDELLGAHRLALLDSV